MAGKFFNQKVKGSINNSMKAYIIVGGVILTIFIVVILIVSISGKKDVPDPIIEVRSAVSVEINDDLPDKTDFFSELQNVKEDDIDVDYSGVDLSKLGSYNIKITIYDKEYKSTLNVIDITAPEFTVKDVSIAKGQGYDAEDFVEECKDNSNEECTIEFYDKGLDQDGEEIDYGSYLAEGTYEIQIVASDSSGNVSQPQKATLTIGDGSTVIDPTTCKYGTTEYDSNTYILGSNVTSNGCALDLNLYQDENTTKSAYDLAAADTEKLQKEISEAKVDKDIKKTLNRLVTPVLNKTGNGLVGYTILMELKFIYTDGSEEVVEKYYLDTEGNRVYSINKYNLN